MAIKDNSMLEIAIDLLEKKHKPQHIDVIIKEVLSLKGLKQAQAKEVAPQFVMDFMLSGYFVYCGDDTWDLKDRQPTSVLDKDGGDFEDFLANDEDVKKNELKDGSFDAAYADENNYESPIIIDNRDEDDEDDEEVEEDEDDLSNEFEVLVENVEEEDEDE